MLLADAAESFQTSQTALIVALTTALGGIVTVVTLAVNKWSESRKQQNDNIAKQQELDAAQGKLDADAVVARARIEAEAMVARAKIEMDAQYLALQANHEKCESNHQETLQALDEQRKKLEECQSQHDQANQKIEQAAVDGSKIWAELNMLRQMVQSGRSS